jgi:hypothetical protein
MQILAHKQKLSNSHKMWCNISHMYPSKYRMNTHINIIRFGLISLGLAGTILSPINAYAQSPSMVVDRAPAIYRCQAPATNVWFGIWDKGAGNVTNLQNFLAVQGHLTASARGYFGPLTLAAVKQFQAAHSVPATGFVGPLTRAAIASICGNPISGKPVLHGMSPTAGSIGTTVTLTGTGFTESNTILMDGTIAVRSVPVASAIGIACTNDPSCTGGVRQTITFRIPEYLSPYCPPGMFCTAMVLELQPKTYKISVENSNGTSNTLDFTVSRSSGGNLSISGVDAPNSLTIGQTGAWTVRVSAPNPANLHYSVVWGDESSASQGIMAPQPADIQSSATFSHIYRIAGTYTPAFTVTDDAGNKASVSTSITVSPLY